MARIVAISSQVASGHVGLSAIVPALQALGHEVIALPTVLLSNHPGRQPARGTHIDPSTLAEMLATLDANGRLEGTAALLTGYLPSAAHVELAASAVTRLRAKSPSLVYLCDPVIGDDPKGIYIDAAAAMAIRDTLVPRADILTPNRFELAWLAARSVDDPPSAVAAARTLARPLVVATSIPEGADRLATLAISPTAADQAAVQRRLGVPNGTGDLLAALFLAARLDPAVPVARALQWTVATIDRILFASAGETEMSMAGTAIAPLASVRDTP